MQPISKQKGIQRICLHERTKKLRRRNINDFRTKCTRRPRVGNLRFFVKTRQIKGDLAKAHSKST